ncbi:MAG: amidohydrolase family protein [Proteobacteria bacterium]|nr:amidohydrolase family protein [Pseudomonadota bacterium]
MADLLFTNATVLDLVAGEPRPGMTVRCEGERIVELTERGARAAGGDLRSIDCRGRTLMPGLIDAHVHASITTLDLSSMQNKPATLVAHEAAAVLGGMLDRGFTTVRDAGGSDWGLAQAVDKGLVRGPRIFYSGRVLSQTGGHGDFRPRTDDVPVCACSIYSGGFSHVADGVTAVRKAAREELRRGATQVKIMASGGVASPTDPVWNVQYSPEEMRAIVEEARGWRTYAMAHAYTPEAVTRAVQAGVRTIEHGNLIDADTARLMAEHGAFLVPTLVIYHAAAETGRQFGFPETSMRKLDDVLQAGTRSLELAREAGVEMGFGTDLLGEVHDQQLREFSLRAEVLPPIEVLRSATTVNARILDREGELGVVAEGALADLLLVDGNPLDDLSLFADPSRVPLVVKAGQVAVERDA